MSSGVGLPPRSRGAIALDADSCTACDLCVKECPDQCITVASHPQSLPPEGSRGRARTVQVLDAFEIDWGLCMYCGICVEVCPFDALFWSPEHDYPAASRAALSHDADALGAFLPTVVPPAPLDPLAEEPAPAPGRRVNRGR